MKLNLALLSLSVLLSAPAFAAGVEGTCHAINATGSAEISLHGSGGKISGVTGDSKIVSAKLDSAAGFERIDIRYISQLAKSEGGGDPVSVTLVLIPSPLTSLAGVNYVGVVATEAGVPTFTLPGPFEMAPDGWNNPFPGLIPSMVPVGYVAFASAYCDLNLK